MEEPGLLFYSSILSTWFSGIIFKNTKIGSDPLPDDFPRGVFTSHTTEKTLPDSGQGLHHSFFVRDAVHIMAAVFQLTDRP